MANTRPTPEDFAILLQRYTENRCSEAEVDELLALIGEVEFQGLALEMIEGEMVLQRAQTDFSGRRLSGNPELKSLLEGITQPLEASPSLRSVHRVHFLRRFRWAAAALFIMAIAGTWFILQDNKQTTQVVYTGNVAPGKTGSKLRLSDNRIVVIDTLKDGLVATENGYRIIKQNGRIVYEQTGEATAKEVMYNEVIADRGNESEAVQLPDGSVAWLNAGSSLKYPLVFAAGVREVSMTGEVYFEVVHNAKQPFRVRVGSETIEDLGTAFNVNAYQDEAAAVTTLVEGRISIDNKILKPGQQYSNGTIEEADVQRAIAWHKGYFNFAHADIPTVMRQLSRWYNVDVRYEGKVPEETFSGEMGRKLMLDDALSVLKRIGIRYRIEQDKTIVILP